MSELNITINDLLESGCHFGHQTKRKNPAMNDYIYVERNGISIIDVRETLKLLKNAVEAIESVVKSGGKILFVGTKKQAKEIVKEAAISCGMPYVTERWLGGMLTNQRTILKSLEKLDEINKILENPDKSSYTKKEIAMFKKQKEKIEKNLGGVKDLRTYPDMLFIVDIVAEKLALNEASKLKIPVVAMVDTNADPNLVDYPIPANDDAMKSIQLICKVITEAINNAKASEDYQPVKRIEEVKETTENKFEEVELDLEEEMKE